MQQQQGPCVCGKSLGKHTRRAARRHREVWEGVQIFAYGLFAFAEIVRVFKRGEVEKLTDGFTEGIRALSRQP